LEAFAVTLESEALPSEFSLQILTFCFSIISGHKSMEGLQFATRELIPKIGPAMAASVFCVSVRAVVSQYGLSLSDDLESILVQIRGYVTELYSQFVPVLAISILEFVSGLLRYPEIGRAREFAPLILDCLKCENDDIKINTIEVLSDVEPTDVSVEFLEEAYRTPVIHANRGNLWSITAVMFRSHMQFSDKGFEDLVNDAIEYLQSDDDSYVMEGFELIIRYLDIGERHLESFCPVLGNTIVKRLQNPEQSNLLSSLLNFVYRISESFGSAAEQFLRCFVTLLFKSLQEYTFMPEFDHAYMFGRLHLFIEPEQLCHEID
jgi:hypothetical protein